MKRIFFILFIVQFSSIQAQEPWILENNDVHAHQFIESYDGGLIFAGLAPGSFQSGKVIKYDIKGNMLWVYTFDDDNDYMNIFGVVEDLNGDIIICGSTFQYDATYGDGFLARIDACGNLIWFKVFGEDSVYNYTKHLVLGDNYTVYFNHIKGNSNDDRFTLKHVDADGNLLWSKQYFTNYGHNVNGVVKTIDKGFLLIVIR